MKSKAGRKLIGKYKDKGVYLCPVKDKEAINLIFHLQKQVEFLIEKVNKMDAKDESQ